MRWLFGGLSALAALGALVFAAAYYLLSPVSVVDRSVEIDRPASVIYPLLINLRTFNEYSPWFEHDPKAEYTFAGPPEGTGQSATWQGSNGALGDGAITIVKTVDDSEVDARVVYKGAPVPFTPPTRALSKITLTPSARGVVVLWALTSSCAPKLEAVPCRLENFVAQWSIGQRFAASLAKLKEIGEQLPALDIAGLRPERLTLEPRDFAYIETDAPEGADAFRAVTRKAFADVDTFLKKNALTPASAPMAIDVRAPGGQEVLRAGRPFSGPLPVGPTAGSEVQIGKTPSGAVLKVLYVGAYTDMTPTYAKLDAYIRAHRLSPTANPWEVYLDDPDKTPPDQLRTEIYFPIATETE